MNIIDFIRESNAIEGIHRDPTPEEIEAHEEFLALDEVTVDDLKKFVYIVADGAHIRDKVGMDVRVGRHTPIPGGEKVADKLEFYILGSIVDSFCVPEGLCYTPYNMHCEYETLHPFMDGNGRCGRVLWLWHMAKYHDVDYEEVIKHRGFLHSWYYQSLEASR